MIELRGIGLRGSGRARLEGVDLHLASARVYGLIGPNGAGKTSLLCVIGGLVRPTSGLVIRPVGEDVRIGAVIGASGLHPGRTVGETLRLAASLGPGGQRDVETALGSCGLTAVASRRVGSLSLGMKMRLAVAVALSCDPHILILDEPMNGLDPDGIAWVRQVVSQARGRGSTVVISSHLLGELAQLIDTAVVLSRGRVRHIEDMHDQRSIRSSIRVDVPSRLTAALDAAGIVWHEVRDGLVVHAPVGRTARLAVESGADILSARQFVKDLDDVYSRASSGEHLSRVSS